MMTPITVNTEDLLSTKREKQFTIHMEISGGKIITASYKTIKEKRVRDPLFFLFILV